MNNEKKVAIMYDFDDTLAPGNMQEYAFIPNLEIDAGEFWDHCSVLAKEHNMDSVLAYMYMMVNLAKQKNLKITKSEFYKQGEIITFFNGVETWFKRINDYGRSLGLEVEHYVISCGLKEIIEGTKIAKEFKRIFACGFAYDEKETPFWPNHAINYTSKTQYIYRIRKQQLDNLYDSYELNEYINDRSLLIPHSNMIYVGDGETDVPCMKIVKNEGGHSISVYNPNKEKKIKIANKLYKDNRVNFIAPADYSENSKMEKIVKSILDQVAIKNTLDTYK
ncbi:MAG: haloacid dehalogenase-like hydrolase [Bacilli bacterium]|nr:haloacid dehalogenase-like hydrolase [Bacilli bacterium]